MSCPYWPEISFCLSEVEKEKNTLNKKTINLDTLTSARENINQNVEQLRVSLEQRLDKNYASLIVFAVVAYIDEEIQRHIVEKGQGNWVPLQKDFYGAYNAGNLFYETIDKIVDDPQTPEIVFKAFYFILKKGFLGKYRDSKTHIGKYLEILRARISIAAPVSTMETPRAAPLQYKRKVKPWHYYSGAAVASLTLLGILYFASSI